MRIEGTLSKWNEDRGFGFITPAQGGQDVFVHISAFPKDGVRPTLGETLSFEIEIDNNDNRRAVNIVCPQRSANRRTSESRRTAPYRSKDKPSLIGRVIPLLLLAALGLYGYDQFLRRPSSPTHSAIVSTPNMQEKVSSYRCDGRTHCSQMTSCDEATFFLRNCPGVQMDGNHDGVPCEQQWCTGF